jgi:serine/threonine protein phosphatase PrpC
MALASVDAREAAVAVVCDGVSASQRADAAARAAAAAALSSLVAAVDGGRFDPVMAMRRAVAKAQAAVCAIPHSGADREPPATTLVAAVLGAGAVTVGWVGDSRAYLVGEGGSTLLTRDDTWAAEQVAHGLASEEEAAADPRKHTLTRWLGADWLEHQDPWVISFNVEPPCRIVLCSDGLSNYLPTPARLGEVLAEAPQATALEAARRLTEFACRAGGHDNVTVVVADVGSAWRPVVP